MKNALLAVLIITVILYSFISFITWEINQMLAELEFLVGADVKSITENKQVLAICGKYSVHAKNKKS